MEKISDVFRGLILAINAFPDLPEEVVDQGGIQIGETNGRATSMSISGWIRDDETEEFVCSKKQYKFYIRIIFQKATQTNEEKLNCFDIMESLRDWIESNPSPILSIGNIDTVEQPRMDSKNSNGLDIFSMAFVFNWSPQ